MLNSIKYDDKGLVPAIVQDVATNEVLMMAYMNEESLKLTIEKKETYFYSRSRNELWNKGATSGNKQIVKSVQYDCDGDTLLIKVNQIGVACHENTYTCFDKKFLLENEESVEDMDAFSLSNTIEKVAATIKDRKNNPVEGSYTNYLFEKGVDKILKKVGEESAEVIIGAKNNKEELVYEASDLIYHLLVLLENQEVELCEISKELSKRMK